MYTHKQLQNICMRCQSVQVPTNAFARPMSIQKIFLSSFLFINTNQTLNTNSLFVGLNTDKQIKHVHSNQEKVILSQIFTSAQNTSGLPQFLHTQNQKSKHATSASWPGHLQAVIQLPIQPLIDWQSKNHGPTNQATEWDQLILDRLADLRQRVLPSHQPECWHCSNLTKRELFLKVKQWKPFWLAWRKDDLG